MTGRPTIAIITSLLLNSLGFCTFVIVVVSLMRPGRYIVSYRIWRVFDDSGFGAVGCCKAVAFGLGPHKLAGMGAAYFASAGVHGR